MRKFRTKIEVDKINSYLSLFQIIYKPNQRNAKLVLIFFLALNQMNNQPSYPLHRMHYWNHLPPRSKNNNQYSQKQKKQRGRYYDSQVTSRIKNSVSLQRKNPNEQAGYRSYINTSTLKRPSSQQKNYAIKPDIFDAKNLYHEKEYVQNNRPRCKSQQKNILNMNDKVQKCNESKLSMQSKNLIERISRSLQIWSISLKQAIENLDRKYGKPISSNQYSKRFNINQFIILINYIQNGNNVSQNSMRRLFNEMDEYRTGYVSYEAIQKELRFYKDWKLDKKYNSMIFRIKSWLLSNPKYQESLKQIAQSDFSIQKNRFCKYISQAFSGQDIDLASFADKIYQGKIFIDLNKILQIFGLRQIKNQINLQKYRRQFVDIEETQKSQYIRDLQKQRTPQQIQEQKIAYDMRNKSNKTGKNISSKLLSCINRNEKLDEPFFQQASHYFQTGQRYFDRENPTSSKQKKFIHIIQKIPNYQLFEMAQSVMHRDKSREGIARYIEPKDINQGQFGVCYLLSAIAGLAQLYPEKIQDLFLIKKKNVSDMYGVKLFIDGIWQYMSLDAHFPVDAQGEFVGTKPHGNQIWVLLLQKAWAKAFKTFDNVHGGLLSQGIITLTGAPTYLIQTRGFNSVQILQAELNKGSIVTTSTMKLGWEMNDQQRIGIYQLHAYSLINIYQNIYVNGRSFVLVKLRNPWGKCGYMYDWKFHDSKWTPQLRKRVNFEVDPKDGTFFISYQDFSKYFDNICIAKIRTGYVNSHIKIKCNRMYYYQTTFQIKLRGKYYFTQYFENPRKFVNNNYLLENLQKTFNLGSIGKCQNGQTIAKKIHNKSTYELRDTIQAELQPGKYIIVSSVIWRHANQYFYTLTSYGPSKVSFSPAEIVQSNQIIRALHQY